MIVVNHEQYYLQQEEAAWLEKAKEIEVMVNNYNYLVDLINVSISAIVKQLNVTHPANYSWINVCGERRVGWHIGDFKLGSNLHLLPDGRIVSCWRESCSDYHLNKMNMQEEMEKRRDIFFRKSIWLNESDHFDHMVGLARAICGAHFLQIFDLVPHPDALNRLYSIETSSERYQRVEKEKKKAFDEQDMARRRAQQEAYDKEQRDKKLINRIIHFLTDN